GRCSDPDGPAREAGSHWVFLSGAAVGMTQSPGLWTWVVRGLTLKWTDDRVAQSVEQRTSRECSPREPRAGRNRTATSGCRSMLGRPESPAATTTAGDGKRHGRQ